MIWHNPSFCSFVEKTYRLHLEDALTPQMNKNFKNIAEWNKSLLNPLLLSIVPKLHFLPGSIPWGPCLVPRPSCSRNCHLYTVHICSNKPGSRAGCGTRMWDSPWVTCLCQSTREARLMLFSCTTKCKETVWKARGSQDDSAIQPVLFAALSHWKCCLITGQK